MHEKDSREDPRVHLHKDVSRKPDSEIAEDSPTFNFQNGQWLVQLDSSGAKAVLSTVESQLDSETGIQLVTAVITISHAKGESFTRSCAVLQSSRDRKLYFVEVPILQNSTSTRKIYIPNDVFW
jgi:hypothetical protein